jgi:hypothetical protein
MTTERRPIKYVGKRESRNLTINENRKFYRSVLQIRHGYQPKLNTCKDKQGKMITDKDGIANRRAEYFEELLKENGEEGNIPRTSGNTQLYSLGLKTLL